MIASLISLQFLIKLSLSYFTPMSFDSWGHYYFIKASKMAKTGPFEALTMKAPVTSKFYYPRLIHWLLSFIIGKISHKNIFLVNPIIETMFLFICILILLSRGLDKVDIYYILIIYIFLPSRITDLSIGPINNFTTRNYSEHIFGLIILLLVTSDDVVSYLEILTITLMICIIFMSSKFGTQVVFLILFPAYLYTDFFIGSITILGSVILTMIFTKLKIINTWQEQIKHLYWYYIQVKKKKMPVTQRNSLKKFTYNRGNQTLSKYCRHIARVIIVENSFTSTLIKNPHLVLILLVVYFEIEAADSSFYSLIFLITTITFFVINLTPLIILGEAERYFSHFSFASIAYIVTSNQFSDYFIHLVIIGMTFYVMEILRKILAWKRNAAFEMDNIYEYLVENGKEGDVVLSCPYHSLPPWRILADTKLRPIFPIVLSGKDAEILKRYETYPSINLKYIDRLIRDYNLKWIVIDSHSISASQLLNIQNNELFKLVKAGDRGVSLWKVIR